MARTATMARTIYFRLVLALITAVTYPATVTGGGNTETPEPAADRNDLSVPAPGALPTDPPIPREALPRQFLDQAVPARAGGEFSTDFSRSTISFADVLSGGPPKDGIHGHR